MENPEKQSRGDQATIRQLEDYIRELENQIREMLASVSSEGDERFRNIVEYSTNLFYSHTADHVLTYLSPQSMDFLGYPPEQAMVRWTEFATDNPINETGFENTVRAIETGKPQPPYELELRHKDGRLVRVEVREAPVVKDGKTTAIVGSLTDITDRKRMEQALRDSEGKYRLLVENQNDLVVKVDPDGRILFASPSYCELFGKTEKELLGETFLPLVHEDDRELTTVAMEALYEPPYSCYLEQRAMTKDGWRWLGWSDRSVLDEDGKLVAIVGVGRDITDRKRMEQERMQLEEQLRQSQKMEAIGNLAGGVAHDFNNLLQVINGYTELAESRLDATHPAQDALDQVTRAGKRAADLVGQLLAFGRRTMMQPVPVNLNQELEESTRMLRRFIGEHIELNFNPEPKLPAIHADRGMLEQVLMNLCVNARDAMGSGGRLDISTSFVHFDRPVSLGPGPDVLGKYVLLQVADDGIGMEPEIAERIFEPFFTTKDVGQGTGLGLAMVYGIVKQHGGYIYCKTEKGKGTRFDMYLPAIEASVGSGTNMKEPSELSGHETILLAEDEEMVRSVAAEMLESAGYRVILAEDGLHAVRLFQANRADIDLAIMDVLMPNMTGIRAWEEMKNMGAAIPLLFISGYSEESVHEELPAEGAGRLIQKPFDRMTLLTAVQKALNGE